MIRKLAHLCFLTNDLEGIIAFYRDRLGLSVKFRFAAANNAIFGVYIAIGDTTFIEFFDQKLSTLQWGGDGAPLVTGSRYGHFCFESAAQEQGLREIYFVGDPDARLHLFQQVVIRAGLTGRVEAGDIASGD